MRKIIFDVHTDECEANKKRLKGSSSEWASMFSNFCDLNINATVLFFQGEFLYFEYPNCHQGYSSNCDYLLELLENTLSKSKDFYEIDKSYNLDDKLKDFRLRGIQLEKYGFEINYVYFDNRRKKYAICTKKNFSEIILDNEKLKQDYEEIRNYLIDNRKDYLLDLAEELYYANFVYVSDKEVVRSIDHLTKLFSKKVTY